MKLEIKKLDISSVIFSGFTISLLFISFFVAVIAIFITPSPLWIGEAFKAKFLGAFFYTLVFFIITLAYITFLVFIYNFFVGVVGLRGLKVEIDEETEE
ncbi:MAG: hypothetical protein GX445_01480 [Elusimicrobia bacterium]|jgi:hypothetical protein|nr:hypothetical protein [Elusimicrobiota bacterium]